MLPIGIIALNQCIPESEDYTPSGIMPQSYRKLMRDDVNGDTALDTAPAGTAKEGLLQRLELPKRDNGSISWGPDLTIKSGTRLQDGLLQSDQQLYRE